MSSIEFNNPEKLILIRSKGLKFHAKFEELENFQSIRLFAVTAVMSSFVLVFVIFIIQLYFLCRRSRINKKEGGSSKKDSESEICEIKEDEDNCGITYTYKYPRPAFTSDCVVMTNEPQPKVLLIERSAAPFKGAWAFPGGFMNMDETTEECAIRELKEETGLKISSLYQIGTYSKVDRDPRGRTITVAFLAIIDIPVEVKGQDDAAKAAWFPITDLPHLAFDHFDIMADALRVYARNVQIKD